MKRVLILLAPGFEEIEAGTIILVGEEKAKEVNQGVMARL